MPSAAADGNTAASRSTPPAPTIRVVLADDHPLVLSGLDHLLSDQADFQVIARCSTGSEAIEAVRRHRPDLLVLDLQLPDMTGLDVLKELNAQGNDVRTVVLTARLDEDQLIEALRVGVRGVVLKEMAPKLLLQCLRRVHEGGQWLEKESAARAMAKLVRRESRAREIARLLTVREIEVVRLVAEGRSNRDIAAALSIAEGTVKIHLHNIYDKLKVSRRTELVHIAREYALI